MLVVLLMEVVKVIVMLILRRHYDKVATFLSDEIVWTKVSIRFTQEIVFHGHHWLNHFDCTSGSNDQTLLLSITFIIVYDFIIFLLLARCPVLQRLIELFWVWTVLVLFIRLIDRSARWVALPIGSVFSIFRLIALVEYALLHDESVLIEDLNYFFDHVRRDRRWNDVLSG